MHSTRLPRPLRFVMACAIAWFPLVSSGCNVPDKNIPEAQVMVRPSEDAAPLPPQSLPYTLTPGDEVSIRFLEEPTLDMTVRIDADGGFQFPYAGRVRAEGLTTTDLSRKLTAALSENYVDPHVTVNLVSPEQMYVQVMGFVVQPGRVPYSRDMRIMDALAAAGGLNQEASWERVLLIRRISDEEVAAGFFNYREAMLNPLGSNAWASNVPLQRGDTIFVPKSDQAQWESAFRFVSTMFGAVVDVERSIVLYPDVRDVIKHGETTGRNTIIVR